jgi:hypothetical protein
MENGKTKFPQIIQLIKCILVVIYNPINLEIYPYIGGVSQVRTTEQIKNNQP